MGGQLGTRVPALPNVSGHLAASCRHGSNMSEAFCLGAGDENQSGLDFGLLCVFYFNFISLCQEHRPASSCLTNSSHWRQRALSGFRGETPTCPVGSMFTAACVRMRENKRDDYGLSLIACQPRNRVLNPDRQPEAHSSHVGQVLFSV